MECDRSGQARPKIFFTTTVLAGPAGSHFERAGPDWAAKKDAKKGVTPIAWPNYYYHYPQHGDAPRGQHKADFNLKKDPKDAVAGHIHDHLKGEEFSDKKNAPVDIPKDMEMLKERGIPGYLLTPKGYVKKYDPKTDKTTTVGRCE